MLEPFFASPFLSVTVGFIVFFIGVLLTRAVPFLRNFSIPEPVSGGLTIALAVWALRSFGDTEIIFDLSIRDHLLVIFFACIGLNARVSDLFRGGRKLAILLVLTMVFMVLQNFIGVLSALGFGLPSQIGVLIGSASLIGGHGTAIAWGPTIETTTGFAAAAEIGVATATLGLICAALIGGPIAKYLIEKNGLTPEITTGNIVGLPFEDNPSAGEKIDHITLIRAMLASHIAVILGYIANEYIADFGVKLPLFVPCLLVGIVMSNTIPQIFPRISWPARTNSLALLSDYCLSVFLAMSLMSMQLWTLAGLGGPLFIALVLQVLMTVAFILFLFYRLMGGGYEAAVLSSGFAGFGLGATPTAIANMSAVTKRYGPAPIAFIILPLVSAFFVDLANAAIIQVFLDFGLT